jgi:hypothetical protein
MTRVVKLADDVYVELEEDASIVAAPPSEGLASSDPAEFLARLSDVGDSIVAVCRSIRDKIETGFPGATKPSELTLEFGVKLAGEGGLPFVTKVSGEATFKVAAKWQLSRPRANV